MNRTDFQTLAERRLQEAQHLCVGGFWDGAYYLGGYAVECALKACIARQIREHDFPDKRFVERSHTHDLQQLVVVAGLEADLRLKLATGAFKANWDIVKGWTAEARYLRHVESKARDLIAAVAEENQGILSWLRNHW
jgi:HEPN domain-containing protein